MKYEAYAEPMLLIDEVPIGATITSRGTIRVLTDDDKPYNTYAALVYEYEGKQFAVYLDKAAKAFRSVPLTGESK